MREQYNLSASSSHSPSPSLPSLSFSLENLDVSWAWLEAKDLKPLHRAVEEVTEGGQPFLLRRLDMSKNMLDDAAVEMLISLFENTEKTIEQVRLVILWSFCGHFVSFWVSEHLPFFSLPGSR